MPRARSSLRTRENREVARAPQQAEEGSLVACCNGELNSLEDRGGLSAVGLILMRGDLA